MRHGIYCVAVVVGLGGVASLVLAGDVVINSFNATGQLTFRGASNAVSYRIEWASSANGPWTNFAGASARLDAIPSSGTGIVTAAVPMCYRVVATVVDGAPAGMALIPAGTNSGTDPECGAYSLTLATPLYMDKYEVTKAQWDAVYNWAVTNGYSFANAGSGKAADHPVQTVNWYDCVKWCNARSQKEGLNPAYYLNAAKTVVYKTGQTNLADNCVNWSGGYRLPTETEWEYAARGGLSGRRYSWGDTIDHDKANYCADPYDYVFDLGYAGSDTRYAVGDTPYTSPVGSFEAGKCGYGLYDMAGNVMEWCWNWCPGYEGTARVMRGGSWYYFDTSECLVGWRSGPDPSYGNFAIGFRTVLQPGP